MVVVGGGIIPCLLRTQTPAAAAAAEHERQSAKLCGARETLLQPRTRPCSAPRPPSPPARRGGVGALEGRAVPWQRVRHIGACRPELADPPALWGTQAQSQVYGGVTYYNTVQQQVQPKPSPPRRTSQPVTIKPPPPEVPSPPPVASA